jgi:carotenoid cleavage dioxygenase
MTGSAAAYQGATRTAQSGAEQHRAWWANAWRPSLREDSYRVTKIEGSIPRELHGTLYRNGPSQRILPEQGYQALHLFDGDGLVHAFRFDDGQLDYTGRFVRNESFRAEEREGRFCMTAVGVAAKDPITDIPIRQQPNTNVLWHGGKLLALVENALPFEIDARTLAPVGTHDFGGSALGMATSAHPKIDGRTGQMLIHGYQPFPPYVQWYAIERDGRCSLAEAIDAPYAAMMHDFAITERYVIFLLCPIVMSGEALMTGSVAFADALSWKPELGMKFGVKRREAGAPVTWLDVPTAGYVFHPGNAYEIDGNIVLDACTYLDPQALLDSLRTWRQGIVRPGYHALPYSYELDLAAGRVSERRLGERPVEFPRIDDRLVGYPNRYGYAVSARSAESAAAPWSCLVRYDRTGRPASEWDFGDGCWPSEPVFVPRSQEAAEDDGFVLCTLYDGPEDGTSVVIFDAANLAAGPLVRARLEHRLPHGFHGNFAAGVV